MDFRQITQPTSSRPVAPATSTQSPPERHEDKQARSSERGGFNWLQVFNGVILVGIALLIGLVALAVTRVSTTNEGKFVDTSKYQAIFLNNGQVYFGNITSLNNQYVRMANIYYLTQSASSGSNSSSNNYSLVKLGCQQIHDPYDAMVINRDQITFWENLQDGGKVVSSIKQFIKQNPNGPDCSQVSSQTQASSSTTQGTSSGNSSSNSSSTNSSTNSTK